MDQSYPRLKQAKPTPLPLALLVALLVLVSLFASTHTAAAQADETASDGVSLPLAAGGEQTADAPSSGFETVQASAVLPSPYTLPPVSCPTSLQSCTANDVQTTVVMGTPIAGDSCTDPSDTITLDLTVNYKSTAAQRYDLGVFMSTNGLSFYNPVQPGAACVGAAATPGTGDPAGFTPPGTGQLFLDLDPNHTPTDTCGDLDASSQPLGVNWTVRATVACVPNAQNQLVIRSCRVWQQNANHQGTCTSVNDAGTGSKCDCTDLVVTNVPVPSSGTIVVNKVLTPAADPGKFNLQIDNVTKATNVGNGGTTGAVTVSAGTSANPGATHTVGETAGAGTDLADYNSSISCTKAGLSSPDTDWMITVLPNDAWICTITNTPKSGALKITKTVDVGGSSFTSGSFGVSAACTNPTNTYPATINFPTPGEVTITGIPANSVCTVTETSKPTAPAGYSWAAETITGNPATITSGGTANVTVANKLSLIPVYLLNVDKSSTTTSITAAGQEVPYTFVVTNIGNQTLTGVAVFDPMCTSAISGPTGDTNNDGKLDLTESWTYTCSHTVTQAEVDAGGKLSNTVTADSQESDQDTDTLDIPVIPNPALKVVKSSDTTVVNMAGQVVYQFTVTNIGNVTLTGITVTDAKCNAAPLYQSGDTNGDGKLDLTESWLYTCLRTVTQAEVDTGGNLANTVTADSQESDPDTDTLNIPISRTPAIKVVKSSTTTAISAVGQVVPYLFTVTNAGNVTLTGITVTDAKCNAAPLYQSGDTSNDGKLDLTEIWLYTCLRTVTQAELDAGSNLSNTVTADSQESAPDTDTLNIPVNQNPAIKVVKSSATTVINVAGQVVLYQFTVTNIGSVTLTGITVTDAKCTSAISGPTGDTNNDGKLQTTESWLYTCSHTVTQAEVDAGGNLANTVTADSQESTPSTDTLNIPISRTPAIQVVKSSTTTTVNVAGQVVPYQFTVTNVGNVTLTGITVTDANCNAAPLYQSGDTSNDGKLDLSETWLYTCSHTVTQAEVDTGGNLANTVTADSQESTPDTDTLNIPISRTPAIKVVKSSATTTVSTAGQVVVYQFAVTNVGNMTLTGITVTDAKCNAAPVKLSGDTNGDSKLDLSEIWLYTCSHTVTQAEVDAGGNLSNTVTADSQESAPSNHTLDIPITQNPALKVAKTPDLQTVFRGDTATFTIIVTNIGNMTLTNVAVSDPNAPDCSHWIGTLAVGAVHSYSCQSAPLLTGFTNTAIVAAKETGPVTDDAVVRVADLAISKSPDLQVIQSGASFAFTIRVENTGEVALTNVTVSDALAPDCDRTFATLAVGEIQEYLCTLAGVTASFVNTAIADADQTPPVADTAAVQVANLLINKSADPIILPEPGGRITFTVDIQNTASTTLTLTALNDAPFGNITQIGGAIVATTCVVPQRLAPAGNQQGFRYACTFTVELRGEPNNYLDIVTATLQDRQGNQIRISDDATVTITGEKPMVDLAKAVTPASRLEPGGPFVYTLTVTNHSVEPVTIVELSDSQAGQAVDFSKCTALVGQSLAPSQSVSCQYTVNHTEAGTHLNTAAVVVSDNENNNATDIATASITVDDALPSVTLRKSATPSSRLEPGGVFLFMLTVTNTSVEPVIITTLTDSQSAQAANFSQCAALIGQTLAPNQSVSCQYNVTYTETGAYPNQAAVTVRDNEQNTASSEDAVTVTINDALPVVALVKEATPDRLDEPGGAFVFKLTVTNNSVEPVIITALTDSQSAQASNFGQCTALIGQTLAPKQSVSCQYTVNHIDAGSYNNQASVTVRDNENNNATDQSFITVVVGNTLPSVSLTKRATPNSRTEPGGPFVFTLVITNTSVEPVIITALTDSQSAQADFSQCQALIGQTLAINEVRSCQYTVVHTDAGVYPNEANVTVRDNENNTAAGRDVATVTVNDALPLVSLTKSAGPARLNEPGGPFVFTLTVTNNGVEPVTIAELTDSQQAQAGDFSQCTALVGQQLAPGQSRSCQYTVTHTNAGIYGNQAAVTVSDDEENLASDETTTTVAVNDLLPLIRVSKNAQPGAVLESGGDVLFLVEVYNDGVEPLRLTALVDDHFGNLNGVGTCAVPQTVASGGVYRCTFTKTVSGQFGTDHRNTVTATVNDDDGNTTTGSDDATVTLIDVYPNLQVTKDDKLQVDADRDGRESPGDTLRYIITLINTGNGTAFNTLLADTPDPHTKLVAGTVVTSKGIVRLGNGVGDTTVEVEIGDIAPNGAERVQIIFDVVISPQITLPLVRNQAVVTNIGGQNEPPTEEPSDDPSTPKIDDETITEVFIPTAEEEVEEPIGSAIRRLFLPLINKR